MPQKSRFVRLKATNRFKCLLCYLIGFTLTAAYQLAALAIYPYTLAGTAPDAAARLLPALPALSRFFSSIPETATAEGLRAAQLLREQQWLRLLLVVFAAAWILTLLVQLIWRCAHRRPEQTALSTRRAIRAYRLTMLVIWLINAAFAAAIWLVGVRYISARTLWDYAVYFGAYVLMPLAAWMVSRLAAPPAISGKHAFFKRL